MPGTSRRELLKAAGALAVTAPFATACAHLGGAGEGGAPEVIFQGGPILTVDDALPRAEALSVRGGRILKVGDRATVLASRGRGTKIVDLDGRTLTPGLFDPQMRTASVFYDFWLDVGPFTTATVPAVLDKISAAATKAGPDGWILAYGFDPSIQPGGPLSREGLDQAAPRNPVFVMEASGKVAHTNSQAGAPEPPPPAAPSPGGFSRGIAPPTPPREFGFSFPPMTIGQYRIHVRRLMDRAAAAGCTSLHDGAIGLVYGEQELAMLQAVMQGDPPVRMTGALLATEMDAWFGLGLRPGWGDDRFAVSAVAFHADGSCRTRNAFLRKPYLRDDDRGDLTYTPESLTAMIDWANRAGWQLSVQAEGDAAADAALAAFRATLTRTPRVDHRHRLDHCTLLHPEQVAEMARLEMSPCFLGTQLYWWGQAFQADILGPARTPALAPCASALAAGLKISLASDFNVTPIGPLHAMDAAVSRRARVGGEVLGPDQRITPEQALRAVTLDAAWQCRREAVTGSLTAGKYADLCILERDPTQTEPGAIGEIRVSETWLAGRRRHAA